MVSRVNRGPALRGTGLVSEETIMLTDNQPLPRLARTPWNKGRLIGQKRPLKPKDVWAIRVRLQLQLEQRKRDLALFNLAIDSKLRGCDLVRLRVNDMCVGPSLGRARRSRQLGLRDSLAAANQGGTDLQEDRQLEGGAAITRAHEARK